MRSFFSPETLAPTTERPTHKDARLGLLAQAFNRLGSTVRQSLEHLTRREKTPTLWSSERYFGAAHCSATETEHELVTNQLRADMHSFLDEYAFLRARVSYAYDEHGIRNGYTETMSEVTGNFVQKLTEQQAPTTRAKQEHLVAQYVEAWMRSPHPTIGERLISISPRGTTEELYPGLDERNYAFVNVYEKTETGFELHQYRSYDTNAQLPDTLRALAAAGSGHITALNKDTSLQRDHQLIATIAHLPSTSILESLENCIYARKSDWAVDIDRTLPALSESAIQEQLHRALSFCMTEFSNMQADENFSDTDKIQAFDMLVTLVRKSLLKWVENHASNYDSSKQRDFKLDYEILRASWLVMRKEKSGENIDNSDKKAIKTFTNSIRLNATLPLKSAASWAHCITGTPSSLLRIQPNSLQLDMRGGAVSMPSISTRELSARLTELESYSKVIVNGQVWYVPVSYFEGKGCYYDPLTAQAMGPCGIPLTDDPYALTAAEYFQNLEYLHQLLSKDSTTLLTTEENAQILPVFNHLLSMLMVSTTNIERVLLLDVLRNKEEVPEQLHVLYERIAHTLNPLQSLIERVIELHRFDLDQFKELELFALGTEREREKQLQSIPVIS